MKYVKETLSQESLIEFRILCELPTHAFACFEIPDPNDLLSTLASVSEYMDDIYIKTPCVMIPIELIFTESFQAIYRIAGAVGWGDFIKSLGLFGNANIVFYKTNKCVNFNIEL